MNSLIILPEELTGEASAKISGKRFLYLQSFHDLKGGLRIRGAVGGGKRGYVTVTRFDPLEEVAEFELEFTEDPYLQSQRILLVAIPRPPTIKRLLHLGAMFGLARILFVRTDEVEKSYLQSRELTSVRIQEELLKGLEQSGDSVFPEATIYTNLFDAISSLPPERNRYFADTRAQQTLPHSIPTEKAIIAIGPEKGWSGRELEYFTQSGFMGISLGPRILRVDVAASYLLGQLDAPCR